jgi:hypothetical protein
MIRCRVREAALLAGRIACAAVVAAFAIIVWLLFPSPSR